MDLAGPAWLALRTPPPPGKGASEGGFPKSELGGLLFSHTSPVYVEVGGKAVWDAGVARGLLEEVRRAKETILQKAIFADGHEKAHVLGVYDAAVETLEKLIGR